MAVAVDSHHASLVLSCTVALCSQVLKNTALFTLNTLIIQFATLYVNIAKARPAHRTRLRQTQKEIHSFTICEPKQKGLGGDLPLPARKNKKPRKTEKRKVMKKQTLKCVN